MWLSLITLRNIKHGPLRCEDVKLSQFLVFMHLLRSTFHLEMNGDRKIDIKYLIIAHSCTQMGDNLRGGEFSTEFREVIPWEDMPRFLG